MLVLVRQPALLLNEFFDIWLDGQVGGICQICTNGIPYAAQTQSHPNSCYINEYLHQFEADSAVIIASVDLEALSVEGAYFRTRSNTCLMVYEEVVVFDISQGPQFYWVGKVLVIC